MDKRLIESRRKWADDNLEAWLDGELNTDDARRMERIIASSPGLQQEVDLARGIRRELQAMPDYRCPPIVSRRVFGRTRRRFSLRDWLPAAPVPRWGLAGLAAAVLLALGLWIAIPQLDAPGEEVYVMDGQTFTATEVAEAQAQLQVAMAYVDQLSNEINRQVGQYVAGDGILAPVNKGLNRGASNARESLQRVYRETSS